MSGPLLAEFRDPEALSAALRRLKEGGTSRARCLYAVSRRRPGRRARDRSHRAFGTAMLAGGLLVAAFAFALQWYSAVIDYPMNSGGRPLNSWQVFWLVPFEVGVFAAALCGVDRVPSVVRPAAPASSPVRNTRFRARDAGSFFSARRRRAERRGGARSSPHPGNRGCGGGDGGPSAMTCRVLLASLLCCRLPHAATIP